MAATFKLYSQRNTGQKCRAMAIADASKLSAIEAPDKYDPDTQNAEIWYKYADATPILFRVSGCAAPEAGDFIVAYGDKPNYLVKKLEFRDGWHVSTDVPQTGSVGAVTNAPPATGAGGSGTQA